MDFAQQLAGAIHQRRSIRQYRPEPVSRERITELLALAGRAPSAWNLQPWRFAVVDSAAGKQQIQQAAFNQPQAGAAAANIVLYTDMQGTLASLDERTRQSVQRTFGSMSIEQQEEWGLGQTYIALGYLIIVLEAYGYGSSPMLGFDAVKVKTLLQLPDYSRIAAIVAFGLPADAGRESVRRPVNELIRWHG